MALQTTLATLTVRHVFTIRPADLIICSNLLLGVTSSDSEVKLGFTSRPQSELCIAADQTQHQ